MSNAPSYQIDYAKIDVSLELTTDVQNAAQFSNDETHTSNNSELKKCIPIQSLTLTLYSDSQSSHSQMFRHILT